MADPSPVPDASEAAPPSDPARPRELSVNSAMAVQTALTSLIQAVDYERALTEDEQNAVNESMEHIVAESIKTELLHKEEATTHSKIPYTEMTLALIKPDALKAGHEREIRYAIHANGFVIVHEALVQALVLPIQRVNMLLQLTKVRAAIFYEHHRDKPWFERLVRYISSAPARAFVLGKERAARSWNVVIGPADPEVARKESPQSLRARFGTDILRNAVHGSFNPVRAREEIKLLFPNVVLDPVLAPPKARHYFDKKLKRTLIMGLTALAKAKPDSEALKVIRWFAQWLQEHNPNRPYVDGKRHVEVVV